MTRADLHTHVFNVGFLPIEGFLRVHGVPDWLAAVVTEVFEQLLERDTPKDLSRDMRGDDDGRTRFMKMLAQELTDPEEPIAFDAPDFFARLATAVPRSDIDALSTVLKSIDVEARISPSVRDHSAVRMAARVNDDRDELRRRLDLILREADKLAAPIEGEDSHRGTGLFNDSVGGTIKWLAMLVQHEARIAAAFADYWSRKPKFDFRVHHMMDMRLHYDGRPPVYDFEKHQLPRMIELAKTATPRLVGFVAFDPFRDEWERIIDAARAGRLAGVKFYPPNGFRPIDNKHGDIVNGPSPAEVNRRNLQFFHKCVAENIPVFTHCTPTGVESRPKETGSFSNPRHWRVVLETKGLESLRLCFGHAGGQEGWLAPDTAHGNSVWANSYAAEVVDLCGKFENVYCDFGMFDGLLDGGAPYFRDRLKAAIKRFPGKFALRCCYGTDWHLVSRKKHAKDYVRRFESILTGDLAEYREPIMYENAKRFVQLLI
jgi:predicted TIM-barrel fold metal-dependent hydrolase